MSFESYWDDDRFRAKRPDLRGSKKQLFGDNIYHREPTSNEWIQSDSRHSNLNGSPHQGHIERDTKTDRVLVSNENEFAYWGVDAIDIPPHFRQGSPGEDIVAHRGHKNNFSSRFINDVDCWFRQLPEKGFLGRPTDWSKPF